MDKKFQNKYFWSVAKGKSMSPFIKEGDRLLLAAFSSSQIKPGDIVAIKTGPGIVIHRLIRKYRRHGRLYFQEKGDGNLRGETIAPGDILGKAILIKRGEKEKHLNRPLWQIFNRIMGTYGYLLSSLYQLYQKTKQNTGHPRMTPQDSQKSRRGRRRRDNNA